MKIQYLSRLTIAALLSVGAVAACANPCAAKTSAPGSVGTEVKANPCAAKTNPCAAKTNPCAAKTNPCAAKTNPCAAKTNPCAAKTQALGGPLAAELQDKPVVVDIFASWCPACKNIAPTLTQLKQDYDGRIHFVVLDVSDPASLADAESKAEQLGLGQFLAANKAQTGSVAIIDPTSGTILAQYRNNANQADYSRVIDAALNQ